MQRKPIGDDPKLAAIRRCLAAHPDWTAERLRNALKRWRATTAEIRAVLAGGEVPAGQTPKAAGKAKPAPAGRTLEDFRREHDQTWKIRDGLRRLFAGRVYMTDAEFREAVSGNPNRWRAAADQGEFRENRYRVGGELLWASKDTIREMRKIRGEAI